MLGSFFSIRKSPLTAGVAARRRALALLLPLLLGGSFAQAQTELSGLEKIQASGVLKVAVYKDNAPFSDGPVEAMKGLDVELATALARQMKLKLALLPFDAGERMNDDLRNMVWRGHYLGYGPADVMLHVPVDKYLINENRQTLIFAPYMRQSQVLLRDTALLPAAINSPADLKGVKLAAERGTGSAGALMGYQGGELVSQVNLYGTGVQAAQAVLEGKVAAAYVMRSQAENALAQTPPGSRHWAISALPLNGLPPNGWPLGMAIKSGASKDLGQALEKALQALRDSGELLAIFQRNGMTLTAP
jgi:polar amino acid transport system substrate-binding protein